MVPTLVSSTVVGALGTPMAPFPNATEIGSTTSWEPVMPATVTRRSGRIASVVSTRWVFMLMWFAAYRTVTMQPSPGSIGVAVQVSLTIVMSAP